MSDCTSFTNAQRAQRAARFRKAKNLSKKASVDAHEAAHRPHAILGLRPGEEQKWEDTKLCKTLIKEADVARPINIDFLDKPSSPTPSSSTPKESILHSSPKPTLTLPETQPPKHLAFGLTQETAHHLLNTLPKMTVDLEGKTSPRVTDIFRDATRALDLPSGRQRSPYDAYDLRPTPTVQETAAKMSVPQSQAVAKIIDLSNASARGLAFVNRKRVVEAFSNSADGVDRKGPDTGRPEVQAALITAKIRSLWDHLKRHGRDVHNRRALTLLVHQRAKILKYLKRKDIVRYELLLPQLGLEKSAVEGEIVVR
ncbi:hypothetical protein FRB99_008210 [Tulasnella sp. 403]|nr:hypothetical protein FRB99_008210 [Tulasnella sp. 403]